MRYIKHLKREEGNTDVTDHIQHASVKDDGFCVRSCPDFLYQIAKICYKAGLFIDLAVQSLLQYHTIVSYYKNFTPEWKLKDSKAKFLLILILKKMSP